MVGSSQHTKGEKKKEEAKEGRNERKFGKNNSWIKSFDGGGEKEGTQSKKERKRERKGGKGKIM